MALLSNANHILQKMNALLKIIALTKHTHRFVSKTSGGPKSRIYHLAHQIGSMHLMNSSLDLQKILVIFGMIQKNGIFNIVLGQKIRL